MGHQQDAYNPFDDPFNDDEEFERYQQELERTQHKVLGVVVALALVSMVVLFVFAGSALVL